MLIYRVVFKRVFAYLIDLVYPNNCLICHNFLAEENQYGPVCKACWDKIEHNKPPFCSRCGRHIVEAESLCKNCQKKEFGFSRSWGAANYSGIMRSLIHFFKFKNKTSLAIPFARLMADFFKDYNLARFKFDYLIAMPLHPTRLREREYNQSDILCKELTKMLGIKSLSDSLKRIRNTASQSALNEERRIKNIAGAFCVENPEELNNKNLLLIDDLLTTGATCSEAANILRKSGANQVFVLTLATTP